MRKPFFFLCFAFFTFLFPYKPLHAQLPNNLEGNWSGAWNNNNPVDSRGNVRWVLIQAGVTGTSDFLYNDGPGDYMPEFKLKTFLGNPQTLNARIIDPLSNAGNNVQFASTAGNWYMMIVEAATTDNDISILELGSQPVQIDTVIRCPIHPHSTASVSLSVPPSLVLGTGEQLWVHYSIDSFATSSFVQLTGSPPAASIPAFPHDTTVQYYFLTTNSAVVLQANDVEYQAFDIFYQGNYGSYFSYTVDDSNGTAATPCFVFPTEEICGDREDNDGDGLVDGFDPDCGLCTGSLGDNSFTQGDFGTVSADGQHPSQQPDPAANPGVTLGNELPAGVTTYTYGFSSNWSCVNGSLCFPDDGNYVLATSSKGMINPPSSASNWVELEDNGPEADGYMMVVNAAPSPGIFYKFTIENLCPSTVYEFSADVANLITPATVGAIYPNIDFILADSGASFVSLQNKVASANTGDVPQDSAWHTYGFTFFSSVNTLTLALRNNNPGGVNHVGNDLLIDNISFRPCGPTLSLIPPGVFCPGNTVLLDANISSGYNNPQYQWQYSNNGGQTWINVSGATSEDFSFTSMADSDSGYYRILVSEDGNINDSICRIASDAVYLELQCPLKNKEGEPSDELIHDPTFQIIPNPVDGLAEIRFFSMQEQFVGCSLWDVLGKKVWEKTFYLKETGLQQFTTDFRSIASGTYWLRVHSGEKEWGRRLIIK